MKRNSRPPVRLRRLGRAVLAAGSFAAAACGRRPEAAAPAAVATPALTATPMPAAPARAADAGYDLRPAERAALDAFLRHHPDLRAATDADHRKAEEDEGVEGLYGVYHPYFLRGDANDDGVLDFVMGFVRRDAERDTPWFSVVVFAGRADGTFEPEAFLERDISLADGDLSVDRDAIVVTPDVSEDLTRRYRWDPVKKRHVFVRDDDTEEPASPPPSRI
ncbi:MAG TPA: hypothetical protein VGG65_06860 [Thermoanaerobaculia bacterium]